MPWPDTENARSVDPRGLARSGRQLLRRKQRRQQQKDKQSDQAAIIAEALGYSSRQFRLSRFIRSSASFGPQVPDS